jgi:hypothetical protein
LESATARVEFFKLNTFEEQTRLTGSFYLNEEEVAAVDEETNPPSLVLMNEREVKHRVF